MAKFYRKIVKFFIITFVSISLLLYLYSITFSEKKNNIFENFCQFKEEYKQQCIGLFVHLNNPDPSMFFRPPLRKIPNDLLDEFTQHGYMPVTRDFYFDDVYTDANKNTSASIERISKEKVNFYRLRTNENRTRNYYVDWENHKLMPKYSNFIKDKTMTVIGTIDPWLEAIALDAGAKKVVTLGKRLLNIIWLIVIIFN